MSIKNIATSQEITLRGLRPQLRGSGEGGDDSFTPTPGASAQRGSETEKEGRTRGSGGQASFGNCPATRVGGETNGQNKTEMVGARKNYTSYPEE